MKMGGFLRCSLLLMMSLWTTACNEDDMFSHDYRVAFRFYSMYHTDSILARSVGNAGLFCIVKSQMQQGVFHLLVTANDLKTTEDIVITSEPERRLLSVQQMGASNALIIGCSLFDGVKAYDAQCPVCLRDKGGYNYPLEFVSDGQTVKCTKCQRSYNLRAEGAPNDGGEGGKNLLQYPIQVTTQYFEVRN